MIHFQRTELQPKTLVELAKWLAQPAAKTAIVIATAHVHECEVLAVQAAAEATHAGREHTLAADMKLKEAVKYRHFLDVMQEIASGKDLFTGQVSAAEQ